MGAGAGGVDRRRHRSHRTRLRLGDRALLPRAGRGAAAGGAGLGRAGAQGAAGVGARGAASLRPRLGLSGLARGRGGGDHPLWPRLPLSRLAAGLGRPGPLVAPGDLRDGGARHLRGGLRSPAGAERGPQRRPPGGRSAAPAGGPLRLRRDGLRRPLRRRPRRLSPRFPRRWPGTWSRAPLCGPSAVVGGGVGGRAGALVRSALLRGRRAAGDGADRAHADRRDGFAPAEIRAERASSSACRVCGSSASASSAGAGPF